MQVTQQMIDSGTRTLLRIRNQDPDTVDKGVWDDYEEMVYTVLRAALGMEKE